MKKLAILTIFALILVSCGKTEKELDTENNNVEIILEDNGQLPNDDIIFEEIYDFSDENNTNESNGNSTSIQTETEVQIEIDEEISEITEEEILKDIDALINEIINSATNE